jgi:hypothetical protein
MTGTKQLQFHKPCSIYIYLMKLTIAEALTDGWPASQAEEATLWNVTEARSLSLSRNAYGSNTARYLRESR